MEHTRLLEPTFMTWGIIGRDCFCKLTGFFNFLNDSGVQLQQTVFVSILPVCLLEKLTGFYNFLNKNVDSSLI